MAKLDRLLALMPTDRTGVLSLDEGHPARIDVAQSGITRSVTRAPLTSGQILGLLREVAPPASIERLERGLSTTFTHTAGVDCYSARADSTASGWRVRIASADLPVLTLVTESSASAYGDAHLPQVGSAVLYPSRDAGAPRHTSPIGMPSQRGLSALEGLLHTLVARGASDLHLRVGEPPLMRCEGEITRLETTPALSLDDATALIEATMLPSSRAEFVASHDADYAFEIAGCGRFRANVFRDRAGISAVFHRVPPAVVTADDLSLAPEIQQLASLERGLVLVTGPAGSGKSTMLSAMVDLVNRTRGDHIITIEDPIEFVHANKRGIVSQREVGAHTRSYHAALRAALREDPDVVMLGDIRDLDTALLALETAETGRLVLAPMFTPTATMTIERLVDRFPAAQQERVRLMLADTLRAVISLALPRRTSGGRVAAREVLINSSAVATHIRNRETAQLTDVLRTSQHLGMQALDNALLDLVDAGEVAVDEAADHAMDRAAFLLEARNRGAAVLLDAELGPRRVADPPGMSAA